MAKKPFFMRFVETQDQAEVETNVKAGAETASETAEEKKRWYEDKELETMKWPSDGDDDIYW